MTNEAQISRWLEFARNDLTVARHTFEDLRPKQVFISCYHCQQTGEKALKAYLIFKEVEFPFTHDLARLCYLCMDQDESFQGILDDCSDLTPYATQARYPNTEEITEEINAAAICKAERVYDFCASLIG